MKEYDLMWISCDSLGTDVFRERITTDNPKDALFNYVCKMLVIANRYFNCMEFNNIRKNIQTGNPEVAKRERYWVEFPNGEILSCIEVTNKPIPLCTTK